MQTQSYSHDMAYIKMVKAKFEADLMRKPHVVGVGIGLAPAKAPSTQRQLALIVNMSATPSTEDPIPSSLDGVPVVVQQTGQLRAL